MRRHSIFNLSPNWVVDDPRGHEVYECNDTWGGARLPDADMLNLVELKKDLS